MTTINLRSLLPLVPAIKRPIAEGILVVIEDAEKRLAAAEQGVLLAHRQHKEDTRFTNESISNMRDYIANLADVVNAQGRQIKQLTEALAPTSTGINKAVH